MYSLPCNNYNNNGDNTKNITITTVVVIMLASKTDFVEKYLVRLANLTNNSNN